MRLINTTTLQLKEFVGTVPPYAILSHTWGDDEIALQQMQHFKDDPESIPTHSLGFSKIVECCRQARQEPTPLEWAWVDTCCIDKSSSAELQEAINSMFKWYNRATACYAFLADVGIPGGLLYHKNEREFSDSRWFTRGWTLQELIAPRDVKFYDRRWQFLGRRSSLFDLISKITEIEPEFLSGGESDPRTTLLQSRLAKTTVARRMSWASKRQTTRIEDGAYCLLGLFDVHMPMLYGEGEKAFQRLQEEIMKNTDDPTLLGWGLGTPGNLDRINFIKNPEISHFRPLLAPDPSYFVSCKDICQHVLGKRPNSFSMTQRGLEISLHLRPTEPQWPGSDHFFFGILGCYSTATGGFLALPLIRSEEVENEFYQGPWCTPTIVSRQFLAGSNWRRICIRRRRQHDAWGPYDPDLSRMSDILDISFNMFRRNAEKRPLALKYIYPPYLRSGLRTSVSLAATTSQGEGGSGSPCCLPCPKCGPLPPEIRSSCTTTFDGDMLETQRLYSSAAQGQPLMRRALWFKLEESSTYKRLWLGVGIDRGRIRVLALDFSRASSSAIPSTLVEEARSVTTLEVRGVPLRCRLVQFRGHIRSLRFMTFRIDDAFEFSVLIINPFAVQLVGSSEKSCVSFG